MFVHLFVHCSLEGWVLDGFPHNKEQYNGMIDRGIVADDVIIFRDDSTANQSLIERWRIVNGKGWSKCFSLTTVFRFLGVVDLLNEITCELLAMIFEFRN